MTDEADEAVIETLYKAINHESPPIDMRPLKLPKPQGFGSQPKDQRLHQYQPPVK